jgi:hypothetical protein
MHLSKQQYLQSLEDGWKQSEDYKYSIENMKISVENANKALVTADVKESMTMQGQHIEATTQEETTVELIGDSPLITKIVGYSTM